MRTSKPFSTISYNSQEFLVSKLDDLVSRGVLDFWAFIFHHAEEDEKKDHIHLHLVPSRLVDAKSILSCLDEFDPTHPLQPLKCSAPSPSKFADWFLYCTHNEAYLASKGQFRKFTYPYEDFICSDVTYFTELRHQIDLTKFNEAARIKEAIISGMSFADMVYLGMIPVQQISNYRQYYDIIASACHSVHRNGRKSHDPLDPDENNSK